MEIAGYIASLFIGVILGLIGGGGSILTVPVLVYLFALSPTLAISYSLFIVGVTSLAGALNNLFKHQVNIRTALMFGITSVTTVFLTRRFIIPALPEVFFRIGDFEVTHSFFVMTVFAILMMAASVSMIRGRRVTQPDDQEEKPAILLFFGVLIGLVTGFLGAGGGFLLIPALVMIMKLPMRKAIGTSLFIIALNSLIGFLGDLGVHTIDWRLILTISAIAVSGIFVGTWLNKRIDPRHLKKGFGWFVLTTGLLIIFQEVFNRE